MKLAVCLEGTLSDASHRQELKNESFEDYQNALSEDAPNLKLVEFLKHWGGEVFLYSMTPENLRPLVMEWLFDNGIDIDKVFLKKKSDYRPEFEIKISIIEGIDSELGFVLENQSKVADLLREKGYLVLQI